MAEWKPLFEIAEIKQVLQDSNDEVNDPEVRQNIPKKEKEEEKEEQDEASDLDYEEPE